MQGFVMVVLFFDPKQKQNRRTGSARRIDRPQVQYNIGTTHRAGITVGAIRQTIPALFLFPQTTT